MQNFNSKLKIFIAHPDEKLVELHKLKLKPYFQVDSAHDGLASLRLIKLHKPHVILSAIDLPVLSGLSLLKFVRSHPELYARPFIILGEAKDLPAALSLGANDLLPLDTPYDKILDRIYYHININKNFYV